METFISLKTGALLGVGLLCLVGSGLIVSSGTLYGQGEGAARESRLLAALADQVKGLETRTLAVEALLADRGRGNAADVDSLKKQVGELQTLVQDLARRLELHEKKVDNTTETTDKKAKVVKQQAPPRPVSVSSLSSYHVVKNGETLYRIGKRYNISEYELIRLNGLKDTTRIVVGQKLRVAP